MTGSASAGASRVEGADWAFRLVDSDEELHDLAPAWRSLYEASRPQNPFLSYEWTVASWRAHRPGTPFVLVCHNGPRLVGVGPLCSVRRGPFRLLRFMGQWSSDYQGFLCEDDEHGIPDRMLRYLERMQSTWDVAVLRPLCPSYGGAPREPVPAGLRGTAVEASPAPYLGLEAEWNELERAAGGQLRHGRRWVRKFEREGGKIERMSGRECAGVFDEIVEIESRSWKAREHFSWPASVRTRALLQRAIATVSGVEVWLARVQGRPVAYLLNFVTRERAMFYQGAYDQAYRKYYPGGVLHCHAIHAAWSAGLHEYDLLQGDEEYKRGWATGHHPRRYLSVAPDTLRGRAAFATLVAPMWYLRRFPAAHAARAFFKHRWAHLRRLHP